MFVMESVCSLKRNLLILQIKIKRNAYLWLKVVLLRADIYQSLMTMYCMHSHDEACGPKGVHNKPHHQTACL